MSRAHLLMTGLASVAVTGLVVGVGSAPFMASAQSSGQPRAQAPPSFQGHVDLPGVRLWYMDSGGSGTPLVLLHANTGNADSWQYNIPAFAQAGYRVIAFDR